MGYLPLELILQIIDSLVDFGTTTPVALDPSDWRCLQLRQWLLVCKATNEVATRHLYGHCTYIDSHRKLMLLIHTLNPPKGPGFEDDSSGTAILCKHLPYITSMYLAPFDSELDDLPSAIWIFELFCLVSPYLKRLTFDLPLHSLNVDHDRLGVYRYLRDGLSRLVQLEELVYMSDDWHLTDRWAIDRPRFWWTNFPNLKRLAIPSPTMPDWSMAAPTVIQSSLPELQHLVVRLRMLPNIVQMGGSHLDRLVHADRHDPLKIVQLHMGFMLATERSRAHELFIEEGSKVELHSITVPVLDADDFRGIDDAISQFAMAAAVEGTLWTLPTIQHHGKHIKLYLAPENIDH